MNITDTVTASTGTAPAPRLIVFTGLIVALMLTAGTTFAAPIDVDTRVGDNDGDSATCTLFEAVKTAVTAASYGGCVWSGDAHVMLQSGAPYRTGRQLPKVTHDLSIDGHGAIIQADPNAPDHRFFNVGGGATLDLWNLTLAGGRAARGGALWIGAGATLEGHRLVLDDNQASVGGGAVYSRGTIDFNFATVRGNDAQSGGGLLAEQGELTVVNSTFASNTASFRGGAIAVYANVDGLSVKDSTFSANTAAQGGALYRTGIATPSSDAITQVTFKGNSATQHGGGATLRLDAPTDVTLAKSALHGSHTTEAICTGSLAGLTSAGHNAATDSSCALQHADDHPNVAFRLSDLHDDGAFAEVHVPLCDETPAPGVDCSILLDQYPCGSVGNGPDQRGVNRFQFGDGLNNPAPLCDIGAYEAICDTGMAGGSRLTTMLYTDQYKRDDNILNSGACAGRGQTVQLEPTSTGSCEVAWQIYWSQGMGIQAVWFLDMACVETHNLDCFENPEACKNQCTSNPNDWLASLPIGLQPSPADTTEGDDLLILDAPTCSVSGARYVIEFVNGGVDFWDPELDIESGEGV